MSDFTESYLNEAYGNAMSELLKDKNGKILTGAALQQRLGRLVKESTAKQPLLSIGMPDLERSNYGEKAAAELDWREPKPQLLDIEALTAKVLEVAKNSNETLARTKEFGETISNLKLEFEKRQKQFDESQKEINYYTNILANQTKLVQVTGDESDLTVPLKDLVTLIKGVDDMTSLVVDQDLRIGKLEQQLSKNKSATRTIKDVANVILIGSFCGALIGLCLGILYPNQTKLGTTFGFVGGASLALLNKLNPVEENTNK